VSELLKGAHFVFIFIDQLTALTVEHFRNLPLRCHYRKKASCDQSIKQSIYQSVSYFSWLI